MAINACLLSTCVIKKKKKLRKNEWVNILTFESIFYVFIFLIKSKIFLFGKNETLNFINLITTKKKEILNKINDFFVALKLMIQMKNKKKIYCQFFQFCSWLVFSLLIKITFYRLLKLFSSKILFINLYSAVIYLRKKKLNKLVKNY